MKKPKPSIESQCGHEYIISFFTTPEISLCTSSVNSADSLLVFSKERTCLQYGHFAICTSSYVCRENVYCHIYNFKPPNGSALSPFRCFCNGTRSRSHLVGSDCDIDNFQIAENETSSCWFFQFCDDLYAQYKLLQRSFRLPRRSRGRLACPPSFGQERLVIRHAVISFLFA